MIILYTPTGRHSLPMANERPLMKYSLLKTIRIMACTLIALLLGCATVHAREIVDMTGRTVTIPDKLTKIFAPSPPGYNLLYTLAPQLLCGRAHPYRNQLERDMTLPELRDLPLIGAFGGDAEQADLEVLMAVKPDLLIITSMLDDIDNAEATRTREALDRTGIPYVYVIAKSLLDYPSAYEFMGELLGRQDRASELTAYIRGALADAERVVAQVPSAARPKVYYAEQMDGLSTESAKSFHTFLLTLAGDVNVHRESLAPLTTMGWEKVSLELVMQYNPDFILVFEPAFYKSVYKNPAWKGIKAVQNKQVLWIPRGPFNWFDRPPSFMGALGLKWLLANFYPEQYPLDIVQEARQFYSLFLKYDLTPEEMQRLIYP